MQSPEGLEDCPLKNGLKAQNAQFLRYFHWPNSFCEFRPFSLKKEENNFSPMVRLIFDIFYSIGQMTG